MPTVTAVQLPARAHTVLFIGRLGKGRVTRLRLGSGELYFWDAQAFAAVCGDVVWHHAVQPSAAITKAITAILPEDAPRIACSAEEFDFTVGQILTLAGLPLTRLSKD